MNPVILIGPPPIPSGSCDVLLELPYCYACRCNDLTVKMHNSSLGPIRHCNVCGNAQDFMLKRCPHPRCSAEQGVSTSCFNRRPNTMLDCVYFCSVEHASETFVPRVTAIHVEDGNDLTLTKAMPMCTTMRDILNQFDLSHDYFLYVDGMVASLDTLFFAVQDAKTILLVEENSPKPKPKAKPKSKPKKAPRSEDAKGASGDEEDAYGEDEEKNRKHKRTRVKTTTATKEDLKRMDFTTDASRWIVRTMKNMGTDVEPFEVKFTTKQGMYCICVPIHVSAVERYKDVLIPQENLTRPCYLMWHLFILECGTDEEEQHERFNELMAAYREDRLKNYLEQ